jgi:hypothetical protein
MNPKFPAPAPQDRPKDPSDLARLFLDGEHILETAHEVAGRIEERVREALATPASHKEADSGAA